MTTVNATTYAPDGSLFATATISVKDFRYETIGDAVSHRTRRGWQQTSPNQVARVDRIGFLDVITYKEKGDER
jgi:hypothetical protein